MAVTLVTGASSGIGRSLARRLAAAGDPVVLVARRAPLLEALAREIEDAGGRALAAAADVTLIDQVRAAVAAGEAALGPIERLVASAGGGERTDVRTFSAAQVAQMLNLNVVGLATCIEVLLPSMLRRGQGQLVAIGSLAGYRGLPHAAAYAAAKAAVMTMMEALRLDLKGSGVAVTLLLPGFVNAKAGNEGRRPFALELEATTARMHHAIVKRRPVDAFPWPLLAAIWIGRLLPPRAYDLLVTRGHGRWHARP